MASTWEALGLGRQRSIGSLAFDSDGILFAGRSGSGVGVTDPFLSKRNNASWEELSSDVDDCVIALSFRSGQGLFVGGWFTKEVEGAVLNRIAKWGKKE